MKYVRLRAARKDLLLLDQMMLFDDSTSVQGVLGLCHHLQWAPLKINLEVARRIMSYLFSKPDLCRFKASKVAGGRRLVLRK